MAISSSATLSRCCSLTRSSNAEMRALDFAWRAFGFIRTHSSSRAIVFWRACSFFSSAARRFCFASSHAE